MVVASSLPKIATPLGISGSSISERIMRNAPSSIHSNVALPWSVFAGRYGCVPTVSQRPTNPSSALSARLGFRASLPTFVVILFILGDKNFPASTSPLIELLAGAGGAGPHFGH